MKCMIKKGTRYSIKTMKKRSLMSLPGNGSNSNKTIWAKSRKVIVSQKKSLKRLLFRENSKMGCMTMKKNRLAHIKDSKGISRDLQNLRANLMRLNSTECWKVKTLALQDSWVNTISQVVDFRVKKAWRSLTKETEQSREMHLQTICRKAMHRTPGTSTSMKPTSWKSSIRLTPNDHIMTVLIFATFH